MKKKHLVALVLAALMISSSLSVYADSPKHIVVEASGGSISMGGVDGKVIVKCGNTTVTANQGDIITVKLGGNTHSLGCY